MGLHTKTFAIKGFNNNDNFSITFNTDEASVLKSSKGLIWPIQLICNELSPEDRFQPNNVMSSGLWFGKKYLTMEVFHIPYIKELENEGFEWMSEMVLKTF